MVPDAIDMQRYDEGIFWQHTEPSVAGDPGDSNVLSHWSTAEVMSPAGDYGNRGSESKLLDAVDLDNNPWPLIVEGTFTNLNPPSVVAVDVDQVLPEWMNEPEVNSDPTNLSFTATTPTSETPPQVQSSDSHTIPIIHSEPFRCTWHRHGSGEKCHHVAPDRAAFLHHLGTIHKVSGKQDVIITCRLYDHNTTSVCDTPIRRGNFPRHADTHYRVRYYCQHCPPGKYFSRQDSWKKHMDKHAQAAAIPEM